MRLFVAQFIMLAFAVMMIVLAFVHAIDYPDMTTWRFLREFSSFFIAGAFMVFSSIAFFVAHAATEEANKLRKKTRGDAGRNRRRYL